MALDVLKLFFFALAILPRVERDEEEAGVGALNLGEKREVVDGDNALDARSLKEGSGDLLLCHVGALRGSSIGKL